MKRLRSRTMVEGPCLIVDWFRGDAPANTERLIYYPSAMASAVEVEDFMLGWMRRNRCLIRAMTWAGGDYPSRMPAGRMRHY